MIRRHKNFKSELIAARNVDVWIPDFIRPGDRLPVLYMHDGQNVFKPSSAPGGVDWGVDEAVDHLIKTNRLKGVIVVAVWNTSLRLREYVPNRPLKEPQARVVFNKAAGKAAGAPLSDLYLRFLVTELKPFIDSTYLTLPDLPNTFIMGSGMGGLFSVYAVCEFPHIFAGAGCLSPHWSAGGGALVEGLGTLLPPPGEHKFYFDYGTASQDAGCEAYQLRMDAILRQKGYTSDVDWVSLKFEGAGHNETTWRKRIHIPLEFLLGVEY